MSGTLEGALRRWFSANIRLCDRLEARLPAAFTRSLLALHEVRAAEVMNRRTGLLVVDVGGGHYCPFARHRRPENRTTLVAVDILESQLRANTAADLRVAADVCRPLPFADGSVDVIVTRSVLEHLADNEIFIRECARVLRPGGFCVHVMPARYAPFAILNRLLPERVAQALLYYFFPQWREECGFYAYYRNLYYPRIQRLFERHELVIKQVEYRYYQSIYFKFFVPFYLLSLSYDLVLWRLGARRLACQILLVAEKPGTPAQSRPTRSFAEVG